MESLLTQVQNTYRAVEALPAESHYFENLVWTEMLGGPYGGVYESPQQIRSQVFDRIAQDWQSFALIPESITEAGDSVIMVGSYRGTCRHTGKPLEARVVHIWSRESGGVRFEQFTDTHLFHNAME